MQLIELSGNASKRGESHGEALRENIAEFAENIMKVHEANFPYAVSCDELLVIARRNFAHVKAYSAQLALELEGIAAGSNQSLDTIMLLNSFLELEDLRVAGLGKRILRGSAKDSFADADDDCQSAEGRTQTWGCTSFNVMPGASKDGHALVGQTFDAEDYYTKFNVMFKIVHSDGHKELVYSLAGILGLNGMNSAGIGVCINKLVAQDAREGVSYPALIRGALAKQRVGDAFGAIVFARRACGMNYQIASSDGIAWCAETSANDFELLPINGAIAHTNHYISDRMRAYETPGWLTHGGSYVRSQVANRRLDTLVADEGVSVSALKEIVCDHTNYPRCICAHGSADESEFTAFATNAATLYDLSALKAQVCDGRPCEGEFVEFDL